MDAFEQQIAELQRRQQMAQQATGFNAPQGKMVSGRYVKANPLEYLAEALRGAGQSRDSVRAGEEMGALQDKRQKAIADALRGFQSELNPSQAGTGATGMVNDALPPEMQIGAQAQLPPRQPNMQAAFGHLMNSNIGSLQSAGMTGMLSNAQEQAKLAREQALHQQHMKILEQTKGNPQAAAVAGVPDATIKSFYEAKNYGRDKVKYENAGGSLIPVTEYGQPTNVPSIPMTGNPFKDLLVAGPDGKPVVNEPMYAAKSRIANAGAARNSTTVINAGQKGYENESKLRQDFKGEPIYKDYNDMKAAHAQIKKGLSQANPIGDIAAATKIMKLLDPGSVVRESELAIAMSAAGRLDRLQNFADMYITGKKLTPTQRKEFSALSDELFAAAGDQYNKKRSEYEGFAKRYDLSGDVLGAPHEGNSPPAMPTQDAVAAEIERRRKK